MLTIVILFITAALGFLCNALILGKNKYQQHSLINKWLALITSITTIRFLFHGIAQTYPANDISGLTTFLDLCSVMILPCFYLYFENIIFEIKFNLRNLVHFIIPLLILTTYIASLNIAPPQSDDVIKKTFGVIFFTGYLIYVALGYKLLKKNIWHRKSDIKAIAKQNKVIKNWTILLFSSFSAVVMIRLVAIIYTQRMGYFNNANLWIPAMVWMIVFVKIIMTPEILYGYSFVNTTIDKATENVILSRIWQLDGPTQPIISEKDKNLAEKITPVLTTYVHQLEDISFHGSVFHQPALKLEDIALAMQIPTSHLNFIFKFHCAESFTDYKKIVRIHHATQLLESGYLNNNTIESLSAMVGFLTYNTFNVAFKSITGKTTQDYWK